jgi:hypothetical protein
MVVPCRGDFSFRRTARKARPSGSVIRRPGLGWGHVGPAYICSSRKRRRSCSSSHMRVSGRLVVGSARRNRGYPANRIRKPSHLSKRLFWKFRVMAAGPVPWSPDRFHPISATCARRRDSPGPRMSANLAQSRFSIDSPRCPKSERLDGGGNGSSVEGIPSAHNGVSAVSRPATAP